MQEYEHFKTYLSILIDTLEKKDIILIELLELTKEQNTELSKESESDVDVLDKFIEQKAVKLKELERLDQGFEMVYEKVRNDFERYKVNIKNEIIKLQQLITIITDKSVKLKALEQENRRKLELFLVQKRNQIKNFKISSKTAANYYKNMSGHMQESTYFLDKKK